MSQNGHSLLSLSIAAANSAPILASSGTESPPRATQGVATTTHTTPTTTKHRRLSSAGRSRRRLSDARDAAARPFPMSLQTASASLAALSLSSPTVSHRTVHGVQPIQVPLPRSTKGTSEGEPGADIDHDHHFPVSPPQSRTPLASNSVSVAKSGRKRGTIFTCESCSKIYRHPSCLIKHRWEHTPQWREASKFVLSKHQQVQLLEAAAILSHLSSSSASLPEDRSLWPSFLSGGLVPPPVLASSNGPVLIPPTTTTATVPILSTSDGHTTFPVSSSVPVKIVLSAQDAVNGLTGPRLHDYAIGVEGVTHVRPGLVGVPTVPPTSIPVIKDASSSMPVLVPLQATREDDAMNLLALRSGTGSVPGGLTSMTSLPHPHPHSHARSYSYSHARSHSHSLSVPHTLRERRRSNAYEYAYGGSGYAYTPHTASTGVVGGGGWSLPRSSVRSKSGSSRSRSQSLSVSASESRSDDEEEGGDEGMLEEGEDEDEDAEDRTRMYRLRVWKPLAGGDVGEHGVAEEKGVERGERTWDDMEMEMEMD